MSYDKPTIQTSNPFKKVGNYTVTRTIYYGEVISIDDPKDGGRIKVKIPDLDNKTDNSELPWCYPFQPKFFHIYPQVGEIVRILIEDVKHPYMSRFWMGSVISQLHKIGYDSTYTALSTTNMGLIKPDKAPSTIPDADGVFPLKTDVALIGRVNTDIILRLNEVHIRAGKHENENPLKLNTKNPAEISLIFEKDNDDSNEYHSNAIIMGDRIGIISHSGNPQFKPARVETTDRQRIFEEGHPIARGDVLVQALEIMRKAIIAHIHGYSALPADKSTIINDLEKINFERILQRNIVIN
jgi:hypothetical protein